MDDESKIDRAIQEMVARSGLDTRRREYVAEELRGHLFDLIAAKRDEGMTSPQAIEAALIQFGSARTIRRALARQQRAADLRAVVADVRQSAWLAIGISVLWAIVIAATSVDVSPTRRLVIGAVSVVGLSMGLTLPAIAGFCRCRVLMFRAPPVDAFHPMTRVLGWTLRFTAWLSAVWITAAGTFALGTCYFEMSESRHAYAPLLAIYLGQAFGRVLAPACAAAFLGAIFMVIVERRMVTRSETLPEVRPS